MLWAQSVPCSTATSAETTAPLADSTIHDRLDKASPLVDQTHIKFADVSYCGSVNFLLQYTPDAIVDWVQIRWIRRPQCWRNEVWHLSFKESDGGCREFDAPVHRPDERRNPTLGYREYVWQQFLGKQIVAIVCPIQFDTRLDKMDLISMQPLISYYLSVMYKFSTFLFNKVLRWHQWGEVEKVYIYHIILAIFSSTCKKLLKLIEIWQSSDRNNFAQFFLRHFV